MKPLLSSLFSAKATSGTTGRKRIHGKRRRAAAGASHEQLENRVALTVNTWDWVVNGSRQNFAVITSDGGDDVYAQQVATVAQNLFVADNSSFNSPDGFSDINAFQTLYVTNGSAVAVTDVIAPAERSATQTTFVLSGVLTTTAATFGSRGTISYAGNVWSFTTAGATTTAFQLVGTGTLSDPNVVFPRRLDLVTSGGAADFVRVTWSTTPVTSVTPSIGPPVLDIDYNILLTSASGYARGDRNLDPSAGATPRFQLPVTPTNPGGIVPGTLAGTINVDGFANAFRTDALFSVGNNPRTVPLFFGNQNAGAAGTTGSFIINGGTGSQRTVTATGYVDYDLGRIFLEFTGGQDPGPVSVTSASYATFNQDAASSTFTLAPGQDFSRQLYVDLLTPGSRVDIASPVLQTVTSGNLFLNATNVNFNAQTRVNNRFDVSNTDTTLLDVVADRNAFTTTALARAVVDTAGGISALGIVPFLGGQGYDAASPPIVTIAPPPATSAGGVQATATAVVRNGSVVDFIITNPGSGYTTTPTVTIAPPANQTPLPSPSVERLNFNASVAAPIFDLTIADDVNTDSVARGTLFVSPTGSLSGALSATAGAVTTAATSLFVQADKSDLLVEGTIFATAQSYLLRSDAIDQALSPFVLTTVSPRTGADTGLTLGNDADTPEAGAVAANSLSLRTQIDSMRVTAATRKGAAINGPFPYNMSIREVDSISFDAVAASSDVISLAAAGNVGLTSALATAGNVVISAGGDFTVSAPISTSRGAIGISATNVTVSNSLRVLDPRVDDAVDDVTLTATGGSISLTGAITGVNNIRLVQRNPATGAAGRISGSARLTAKGLNVEAEGSATLRSDVSTFEGRTGGDFSLDELNDIDITSLRSPGLVSLTAGGVDPAAGAALRASLIDVTTLQVSAPKGSVDVFNNTSKTLTLGNPATIAAGTATSMKAAGSVVIRSSAGPIVIADAPVGGGGATVVRVATNGVPLDATFAYNTPGQYPSTLTSVVNRLLAIDGVVLRVGDRVLVKDQPLARSYENGVYVVTVAGSAGRPWVLSRATDADTTAEVPEKTPVQVAEGSLASQVYSATYTTTDNVSPISVTTITARADAARVRVASTIALPGTYDAINGTITGFVGLPLPSDGVALGVGDRMLVRLGAAVGGASANGIYEVTDIGGAGSQWILKRALDIDTGLPFTIGAVATTEGSFRASLTGQAFLLSYDSLGVDPLTWDPVTDIEGNPAVRPTTNIGTDDVASSATFVVSSTAGTNDASGQRHLERSAQPGADDRVYLRVRAARTQRGGRRCDSAHAGTARDHEDICDRRVHGESHGPRRRFRIGHAPSRRRRVPHHHHPQRLRRDGGLANQRVRVCDGKRRRRSDRRCVDREHHRGRVRQGCCGAGQRRQRHSREWHDTRGQRDRIPPPERLRRANHRCECRRDDPRWHDRRQHPGRRADRCQCSRLYDRRHEGRCREPKQRDRRRRGGERHSRQRPARRLAAVEPPTQECHRESRHRIRRAATLADRRWRWIDCSTSVGPLHRPAGAGRRHSEWGGDHGDRHLDTDADDHDLQGHDDDQPDSPHVRHAGTHHHRAESHRRPVHGWEQHRHQHRRSQQHLQRHRDPWRYPVCGHIDHA
jgi:hypothetical protein